MYSNAFARLVQRRSTDYGTAGCAPLSAVNRKRASARLDASGLIPRTLCSSADSVPGSTCSAGGRNAFSLTPCKKHTHCLSKRERFSWALLSGLMPAHSIRETINCMHLLSCMRVVVMVSGLFCALLYLTRCFICYAGTEPLGLTSSPAVIRTASARYGLAVASSALNSKSLDEPSASVHSRTGASLLLTPHTLHPRNAHCASQHCTLGCKAVLLRRTTPAQTRSYTSLTHVMLRPCQPGYMSQCYAVTGSN